MISEIYGLKNTDLLEQGYLIKEFPFPSQVQAAIESENWTLVDGLLRQSLESGGVLYNELISHHHFDHTEHIIAIRKAETDEDGIWHDDGSRHMAFTWSLNKKPESITGGELLFCKKPEVYGERKDVQTFSPPPMGTLIIFLTGRYGFEHKVNQVLQGERRTIAGWCTIQNQDHHQN